MCGIPVARKSAKTRGRLVPGVLADPVGAQPAGVSYEDTEAVFRSLYAEHGPPLLRLATTLTGGDRGPARGPLQGTLLPARTHPRHPGLPHPSPQPPPIPVA